MRALLRAARPRQWSKNLLVFGAPAAAGVLFRPEPLLMACLAFVAFTLAASGTYLINDAVDARVDGLHPKKRLRPVAAGIISRTEAVAVGLFAIVLSLAPAAIIGRPGFLVVLLAYAALTISYSVRLKQIAVVDIVAVALGFALRAIAGAYATGVPLSEWFLIVSFFGALFLVAGKRYGEYQRLGGDAAIHRPTQALYAGFYHQHVMTLASGVTLTSYGLWAYQHGLPSQMWFLASFVFLVMVLLRFALLVHAGASDDPVEIVWNDRAIRVLAILWIALAMAGIEVG
jgi:decaprenyl-phosphate phosphoribosyltransferase